MLNDSMEQHNETTSGPYPGRWGRLLFFLIGAVGVYFLYQRYGQFLNLEVLAEKETALAAWRDQSPLPVLGGAFVIYTLVTGFSLPGAAIMTLALGWFLGFGRAFVLVSFASTAGATLAFLISRFLLRDFVQTRFKDRLTGFNEALKREGAFYLFTLRLIPVVPFFVINLVMGLTPLPVRTFWWVSQLGMLPGTAVFVYAGSQFPSLQVLAEKGAKGVLSPQLIVAFVILGLFPLVVKKVMHRFSSSKPVTTDPHTS